MKFKRILAAVLSILMLVSAMSFTAMADGAEATPDETLALSNLLINYDQAGGNYPQYKHFGVDADELAASEITITLPYGWDTSLVPQPGTYKDVTTNGNPKNMVIVPMVTEGTAVYTAPAAFDGTGNIRITSADETKYKDIAVKFEVGAKPADLSSDVTKFTVVSGGAINKALTETGTFHEVASTHYTPDYGSATGYTAFEGYATGMFTRPYHLSSYKQYRALIYYDTGADKKFDHETKFQVTFGTYAYGNLALNTEENYKGNRWEYVYVTIPDSSWGWIMQERFRFFAYYNGNAFTDDSIYIAEFKLLADGDEKFQQYKPVELVGTDASGGANGSVSGLAEDIEYSLTGEEGSYVSVLSEEDSYTYANGTLSGLGAGTYYFRYAARNEDYDPSPATEVELFDTGAVYTATFVGLDGEEIEAAAIEDLEYEDEVTAEDLPELTASQFKKIAWTVDGEVVEFPYVVKSNTTFTAIEVQDCEATLADIVDEYPEHTVYYAFADGYSTSADGANKVSKTDLTNIINAVAGSAGSKVIIALAENVEVSKVGGAEINAGAGSDIVITSAGGSATMLSQHMQGKANKNYSIMFEHINIIVGRSSAGERSIHLKGNNITFGNYVTVEQGGPAVGQLIIGAGLDSSTEIGTGYTTPIVITVNSGKLNSLRAGANGGNNFETGVTYNVGGTAEIESTLNLGGQGNTSNTAAQRQLNGDVVANISDNSKIANVNISSAGIVNGNVFVNVSGGTVSKLNVGHSTVAGRLYGSYVLHYTGGEITQVAPHTTADTTALNRVFVADANVIDEEEIATIASVKNKAGNANLFTTVVTYSGEGTATVQFAEGADYSIADGEPFDSAVAKNKNTKPQLVLTSATETVVNVNGSAKTLTNGELVIELDADGDQAIDEAEYVIVFGEVAEPEEYNVSYTLWDDGDPVELAPDDKVTEGTAITVAYLNSLIGDNHNLEEGYEWVWYANLTKITGDSYTVVEATAFEAYPEPITYTLTFNANGGAWADGDTVKTITVNHGGAFTVPTTQPTKEGHDFYAWSEVELPATVTESKTYTAVWNIKKFTVTFDANGGKWADDSTTKTVEDVEYNTVVTAPAEAPTYEGYEFKGWENISTPITATTTIKAIWEEENVAPTTYTATFTVDGDEYASAEYAAGETILAPEEDPAKDNYEFKGWENFTEGMKMGTEDVTFAAIFEEIEVDLSQLYPGYTIYYVFENKVTSDRAGETVVVQGALYDALNTMTVATHGSKIVLALVNDQTIASSATVNNGAFDSLVITSAGAQKTITPSDGTNNTTLTLGTKTNIVLDNVRVKFIHGDPTGGDTTLLYTNGSSVKFTENFKVVNYYDHEYDAVTNNIPNMSAIVMLARYDARTINTPVVYDIAGGKIEGIHIQNRAGGGTLANDMTINVSGSAQVRNAFPGGMTGYGYAAVFGAVANLNGNAYINVSDNAIVNTIAPAQGAIVTGDHYYNISGGTVNNIKVGATNTNGAVNGNIVIHWTAGTIGAIAPGTSENTPESVVLVTPASLEHSFEVGSTTGITKILSYSGSGVATVKYEDTAAKLVLTSDTETIAQLYKADGTKIDTVTLTDGTATVDLPADLASVYFGVTDYAITYETEDGEPIEGTITSVPVSNPVINYEDMPTPPAKEGHTFNERTGWYVGDIRAFDPMADYTLTGDTIFVAKYEANKYDVKFYELGDTGATEITAAQATKEHGTSLSEADMPAPADTNLEYKWYSDENKQNEVTFPVTITENKNFYAEKVEKTYTVNFYEEVVGETPVYTVNVVVSNPVITELDEEKFPAKAGHTIKTYAGEDEITFPYTVAEDTDITVKYIANSYAVTYKNVAGEDVATAATKTYGTVIEEADMPAVTMPEGMNTVTWKIGEDEVEFPYTITDHTDFVAEFSKVGYTVTFKANGGKWADDTTADIIVTATENTPLDAAKIPAAPTKDGFEFLGWDGDVTAAITADNTTFTAQWKQIIKYTVTYDAAGGIWADDTTAVKTEEVVEGEAPVNVPANPTKSGYRFLGWDKEIPTAVTEPVTLTAQWELITMENTYVGYDIYYLYADGTATELGGEKDTTVKGLRAAVKKYAVDGAKVVFALVDDYTETSSNQYENKAADFVITSVGGKFIASTYHIRFAGTYTEKGADSVTIPAKITIENITIESTRSDSDATLTAIGADLIINNVTLSGKSMGLVVAEGWSWFRTVNRDVELSVKDVAPGFSINAIRANGSAINGNITYNFGGNAEIATITAGGSAGNAVNAPPTVEGEIKRVVNGDIIANVTDNAKITNLIITNGGAVNGNIYANVSGGNVTTLYTSSSSSFGKVYGNVVINYTGGKINSIKPANATNPAPNSVVLVTPASLEHSFTAGAATGITQLVTYSGDGVATVKYVEEETSEAVTVAEGSGVVGHKRTTGKLVLTSDTATVAYVTAGGETKVYDLVNDKEIALASEEANSMTIDLPEGDVTVLFADGVTATFKASTDDGAVEEINEVVYGVEGAVLTVPEVPNNKAAHRVFLGWAIEGTEDLVTPAFGTESVVYVAIFDDEPTYDIIVNGETVVTDGYEGEGSFTLAALDNTDTERFIGWATTQGAATAEYFAGDTVVLGNADLELFPVWKTKGEEDAEYTFKGRYDYSEKAYVIKMYYNGPKAGTAAFGLAYDAEVITGITVEYSDDVASTGTDTEAGEGYFIDVVYAAEGATFGSDDKAEVLIATITAEIAPEDYANFDAETDFTKYIAAESVNGVFDAEDSEWLYIKSNDIDDDIADAIFPIYFTELVSDNSVAITTIGNRDTTTIDGLGSTTTMNTEISFTVEDDGTLPFELSYTVDGEDMGFVSANEGVYTIEAVNVLGDIEIVFAYGDPIGDVAITGITAPVYGEAPDMEADALPTDAKFTIDGITWDPADASFGFDTAYTVTVTLTPAADYIFSADATYTIDGIEVNAIKNTDGTAVLTYTYPATEKELGTATVTVNLIRDELDAAYKNFAKVDFYSKTSGELVATVNEPEAAGASFTIEAELLADEYTVRVSKNGYLAAEESIEIIYKENFVAEVTLTAGNVYDAQGADDNVIDSDDFTRVTESFTGEADLTGDALTEYRALVDIDEDGIVTIFDLVEVKANFGSTGAGFNG